MNIRTKDGFEYTVVEKLKTHYVCLDMDGEVVNIDYDEIDEII